MRSPILRALALSLLALILGPTLCPEPVSAAVIVLKNGEVLIGRIREDEVVTDEQITMRWPYKDRTDRGEIDIPWFRIRWHDLEADEPTDEYWEKFGDKNIDGQWLALYEKWKLRNQARDSDLDGDFLLTPETFMSRASLSPIPVENGNIKIQKPEGWTSSIDKNGIAIFVSDKAGTEGFRARIHVFAVKAAIGQTEDQVRWVESEVAKLAQGSGAFEVRERKRLRPRDGGFDQEMLTLTTRFERPVLTLRKLMFRKKKTYFFSAYSHERDYNNLELLFKACMRSLEIKEDTKKETRRKKPAAPGGGSQPGGG